MSNHPDQKTADAFAGSWNHLPNGSVYTYGQFSDWLNPISQADCVGKKVLELGCGNGSLMLHMLNWKPRDLVGVDLGDSVLSARKNLEKLPYSNWQVLKEDITTFKSGGYDVVYCIGVLHHLHDPAIGFNAVVANTIPGGVFHCWVYAREGNWIVINLVDPLRRVVSRFPWWFIKYLVASPLALAYYVYAKSLKLFKGWRILKNLPLYDYSLWISKREYAFFRHVAFDQLVTPQTAYLSKNQIEEFLNKYPQIEEGSSYILKRNGNSWKFGGKIKN